MPVLRPSNGGCVGTNHAADFQIEDPEAAYITPAKAIAWTLVDLLSNDAARACRLLQTSKPALTRGAYLSYIRSLARTERYPSS